MEEERLGEVREEEKDNGGCYPVGSEDENRRRNKEGFLIHALRRPIFPSV